MLWRKTGMSAAGVIVSGISVAVLKFAAFGVDLCQSAIFGISGPHRYVLRYSKPDHQQHTCCCRSDLCKTASGDSVRDMKISLYKHSRLPYVTQYTGRRLFSLIQYIYGYR